MESEHATRRKLAKVKSQRLARDQVHGNHVSAEGVENNQVVSSVLSVAEFEPCISKNDLRLWCALLHEGKVTRVQSDGFHRRVDFVVSERLARLQIAGH